MDVEEQPRRLNKISGSTTLRSRPRTRKYVNIKNDVCFCVYYFEEWGTPLTTDTERDYEFTKRSDESIKNVFGFIQLRLVV